MDIYRGGSPKRMKPLTKEELKKLREGNKYADRIRQQREEHHANVELPEAEAMLEAHLEHYERKLSSDVPMPIAVEIPKGKVPWWKKLYNYLRRT